MNKRFHAFLSFFGFRREVKKEVFRIVLLYFRVSWLLRIYPLNKYYNRFFLHDHTEPLDFKPFMKDVHLIRKVIAQMPGKPSCLKESMIVHLFFKKRGLYIPLYLGVSTEKEFLAHAWYDERGSMGFNKINAV